MMAKGSYAGILLATADVGGVFKRLLAGSAEVVQEPTEQPFIAWAGVGRPLGARSQLDRTKPTRRRKPMPKR